MLTFAPSEGHRPQQRCFFVSDCLPDRLKAACHVLNPFCPHGVSYPRHLSPDLSTESPGTDKVRDSVVRSTNQPIPSTGLLSNYQHRLPIGKKLCAFCL